MHITDPQVRKLFMEYQKTGSMEVSALKAGMTRKTAAKYLREGRLPSERIEERDWRTRANPFTEHWAEAESMLREAPDLEAKALFELQK